ncbi:MAG: FG-GAP-like repeat-containing protein, partial [Planctomycetota bacterium]
MRPVSTIVSLGLLILALPQAGAMTAVPQSPIPARRVPFRGFAELRSGLPADTDSTQAMVCGDLDGDGDPDLFLGRDAPSASMRQNGLYLNNGHGKFSNATARLPVDTDSTLAVALGDVDGDGDLDLLIGN